MLTIYKASAGSGKTFNLAYEYIKALIGVKDEDTGLYHLNDPRKWRNKHRSILAITFTHKATEEMKSRIIKELSLLSMLPGEDGKEPSYYAKDLMDQLVCDRETLADVCHVAREQLLFDFHYFNVSTIDSFFQLVLRTFAIDIDKPGDYEVELNDEIAVAQGINGMFGMLKSTDNERTEKLSQWLRKFMIDRLQLGTAFNMFDRQSGVSNELLGFVKRMCGEEYKRLMINAPKEDDGKDFFQKWDEYTQKLENYKKEIDAYPDSVHKSLVALVKKVNKIIADNPEWQLKEKGLGSRFQKWENEMPVSKDLDIVAITEILSDKSEKDYSKCFQDKKCEPSYELIEAIENAVHAAKCVVNQTKICKLISKQVYKLGLLEYTSRFVEEYCKENNLILLSETNRLLHSIIDGASMPFVYDRLGVALEHLLIDEFQDTSRMQWENLQPLIDNSLAVDGDDLIIGDEKQSIYRFRNADSTLLRTDVPNYYVPRGEAIVKGLNKKENTNHRSASEVVMFNNTLFYRLAKSMGIPGYDNVKQAVSDTGRELSGYVRLTDLTDKLDKKNKDSFKTLALEHLVEDIKDQMGRGYQPQDIAVLVRQSTGEGDIVVNRLIQANIPVASEESLFLRNSSAIRLIIGVLRIIEDSYQKKSNDEKAKSYKREVIQILSRFEYNLSELKDSNETAPENILAATAVELSMVDNDRIKNIIDKINSRQSSNIITLIELVIKECIPASERRIHNPYLVAFQDRVLEFCSRGTSDLYSFLKWWDANPKLAIPASSQNAVTVMTIHKSKGLEYDCVHIPFLMWSTEKHDDANWYTEAYLPGMKTENVPYIISLPADACLGEMGAPEALRKQYLNNLLEQHIDNLNITYVAFTRAVRELTCYYSTVDNAMYKFIGPKIHDILLQKPTDDEMSRKEDGPEFAFDWSPCLQINETGEYTGQFVFGTATQCDRKVTPCEDNSPEYIFVERRDLGRHIALQLNDEINDSEDDEDDEELPVENLSDKSLQEYRTSEEQERGTFLHDVLSRVSKPDTLDVAFNKVSYRYLLTPEKTKEYRKILEEALHCEDPKVKEWFHDYEKVMNERSIFDPTIAPTKKNPEWGRTFRPDRIVWTADGHIDVVDYKFTHEPLPAHFRQVCNYMWKLRKMGFKNIRGYLWYPILTKIKKVEFDNNKRLTK